MIVVDGYTMTSGGICKGICLIVQGVEFMLNFYLLSMEGCYSIFGNQWLKQLGQNIWEFKEIWMIFFLEGKIGGVAWLNAYS